MRNRPTSTLPFYWLSVLLFLLLADSGVRAASLASGNVRNDTGRSLAHITVSLNGNGRRLTTLTDAFGRYQFTAVESGDYALEFADENYINFVGADPVPDEGSVYISTTFNSAVSIENNLDVDLGDFVLSRSEPVDSRGDRVTVTDCATYGNGQLSGTLSYALLNAREIVIECRGVLAVPELALTRDVKITAPAGVVFESEGYNRILRVFPGVVAEISGIDFNNGEFTDGIALKNMGETSISNAEITGHRGSSATILNHGTLNLRGVRQYRNIINYDSVMINTGVVFGSDLSISDHISTGGPVITNRGTMELRGCQINGLGTNNVWSVNNLAGSTIKLFDCTVTGSSSPILNEGTLEIFDSSIDGNDGDQGVIESRGVLVVGGTGITNNSVSGGIISNSGVADVINSTISGNTAGFGLNDEAYAGVVSNTGLMRVTTSTIAANRHPVAGDRQIGNSGELLLSNTIVSGVPGGIECGGVVPVQSLGHNLHTDGTCGSFLQTDIPFGNPGLDALAQNGGLGKTLALLSDSDAIDAGNCGDGATGKDQRGTARPQGNGCDIGSFERIITATGATDPEEIPDETENNGPDENAQESVPDVDSETENSTPPATDQDPDPVESDPTNEGVDAEAEGTLEDVSQSSGGGGVNIISVLLLWILLCHVRGVRVALRSRGY